MSLENENLPLEDTSSVYILANDQGSLKSTIALKMLEKISRSLFDTHVQCLSDLSLRRKFSFPPFLNSIFNPPLSKTSQFSFLHLHSKKFILTYKFKSLMRQGYEIW